jgi:hypothetical protein
VEKSLRPVSDMLVDGSLMETLKVEENVEFVEVGELLDEG